MIDLSEFFQACDCFGAIGTRVTLLSSHDPSPSRFDMPRDATPRIGASRCREAYQLPGHICFRAKG
jgi:hypothetical protein